jgi:deoxyribonuclease V
VDEEPLIVCLDVDYRDGGAMAAGLWFRGWASPSGLHEATRFFSNPAPYEPGAFYRRELPCLLGVLEHGPDPDIVVVDGYVELMDGEPGLGAHLHKAIARPVIGVAKSRFSGAAAVEVRRGDSQKPLYVTAAGLSAEDAASRISEMYGPFRIPTLLKHVDSLARSSRPPSEGEVRTG